ncbi:hypothetical protein MASR2M18_00600 [Ignavibacteria bacterium]|nr:hypothetical protein [Bacteroidota bacterium]MCZ2133618.1 hypothetical protein [Bacteroidota bacterium]
MKSFGRILIAGLLVSLIGIVTVPAQTPTKVEPKKTEMKAAVKEKKAEIKEKRAVKRHHHKKEKKAE